MDGSLVAVSLLSNPIVLSTISYSHEETLVRHQQRPLLNQGEQVTISTLQSTKDTMMAAHQPDLLLKIIFEDSHKREPTLKRFYGG